MLLYPESINIFNRQNTIKLILSLQKSIKDDSTKGYIRQALATLGHAPSLNGTGIKLLSIDGGGTKGLVILEVLRHIEKITGKPIYKLFDLISGVSTGSILAVLLGTLRLSIDECEKIYKETSSVMFKSDLFSGTSRLLFKHAYYDTEKWENILKTMFTDKSLIETSQSEDCPKVVIISALINTPTLQPFAFRNYNLPDKSITYYESSCKHRVWQAVRASAAAPGFFEEFILDGFIHQDGGILINNPASVAIHEAQILWPHENIQTCVSLGSGRYTPNVLRLNEQKPLQTTSIVTKLTRLIDSATDTEGVHRLLQDLLPAGTYYRLNPTLSNYFSIDETRPDKLEQMKIDALMYIRKNEFKFESAARSLLQERSYFKKSKDWLKLKSSIII